MSFLIQSRVKTKLECKMSTSGKTMVRVEVFIGKTLDMGKLCALAAWRNTQSPVMT